MAHILSYRQDTGTSLHNLYQPEITTISMTQNGATMEQKTTMNVSGIAKKSIAASEFVIPADFKKSESPMDKMMQTLGGGAPKQ